MGERGGTHGEHHGEHTRNMIGTTHWKLKEQREGKIIGNHHGEHMLEHQWEYDDGK
jgi:hypothetical protein